MEPQPYSNETPPVEIAEAQYAAALAMVRGIGRVNPDSFAEDLGWYMGDRDPKTGEIVAPSGTTTSKEQAAAIINDFQSRGILSREADDEGVLSWQRMSPRQEVHTAETAESTGRLKRLASKAGKLTHKVVTPPSREVAKQSRQFASHNTTSSVILRRSRAKATSRDAKQAKEEGKQRNLEELEQESERRSRLTIDEPERTPQASRGRRERFQRAPSAGEIAELVKLKVITPEEGRTLLLGEAGKRAEAKVPRKPTAPENTPHQDAKESTHAAQPSPAAMPERKPADNPQPTAAEKPVPESQHKSLGERLEAARSEAKGTGRVEMNDEIYGRMKSLIDTVSARVAEDTESRQGNLTDEDKANIGDQARKTAANKIALEQLGMTKDDKRTPKFYNHRQNLLAEYDSLAEELRARAQRAQEAAQAVADNAAQTAIDS